MTPKVLVLYPYFPRYRRQILRELIELSDAEFTVAAGTTGRASITPLSKEDFTEMHSLREIRIGPVSIHPEVLQQPGLKQFEAVVLAPATLSLTVWAVLIARRLTGRKTLLWGQCGRPGDRGLKRLAQELMNRLASRLLVYGELEKRSACDFGTHPSKVEIVRNANDHASPIEEMSSPDFMKIARSRGIGVAQANETVHILYIGRVTPEKNLERLLSSIEILHKQGTDVEATIVGDGTALQELKALARSKALSIEFPGGLHSDVELQPYLDRATLIVAPNSVGLLAIDAINNALPVIFPSESDKNGPEYEALTEGINAVGFTELSGPGLADAIDKWLNIAPSVGLQEYEAVTRDSSKAWSPKAVAEGIRDAVLKPAWRSQISDSQ